MSSVNDRIYLERTEKKFKAVIGTDLLRALKEEIGSHLPLQEFFPGQTVTHNNTVYFDSKDFTLLKKEIGSRDDHIRIRARKYEYDTDGFPSPYWIEYKIRKGDIRRKRRLKLKEGDYKAFVLGKEISSDALAYNQPVLDRRSCQALYQELQEIIHENRLEPILLVRYQRAAYEQGSERLSLDWNIRYNHVNGSIIDAPSLKDVHPSPEGREAGVVLEMKYTGNPPSCIHLLKEKYPLMSCDYFSKFLGGMKALLDGPLKKQSDSDDLFQILFKELQ